MIEQVQETIGVLERQQEEIQERLKVVRERLVQQALSVGYTRPQIEKILDKIDGGLK